MGVDHNRTGAGYSLCGDPDGLFEPYQKMVRRGRRCIRRHRRPWGFRRIV